MIDSVDGMNYQINQVRLLVTEISLVGLCVNILAAIV